MVNGMRYYLCVLDVDSCVGPSGKLGLCISLKSCPTLFKILREDPIRPSRIKFLQSSTCAFNYEDPWVCCPSEEEEEDDQSKSTASTTIAPANNVTLAPSKDWVTTEPPKPLGNHLSLEIEKHRNFKFLPKPQSCGASASQTIDRIIGGTIAGLGTFPWMALLAFKGILLYPPKKMESTSLAWLSYALRVLKVRITATK